MDAYDRAINVLQDEINRCQRGVKSLKILQGNDINVKVVKPRSFKKEIPLQLKSFASQKDIAKILKEEPAPLSPFKIRDLLSDTNIKVNISVIEKTLKLGEGKLFEQPTQGLWKNI